MAVAALALIVGAVVAYSYYRDFARVIDQKLAQGPFQTTSKVYAAPLKVSLGDAYTPDAIVAQLKLSGYDQRRNNSLGWYRVAENVVEVYPGPESYFDMEGGVIRFSGNRVSEIISLRDNTQRNLYLLEPELVTHLSDTNREKRRLLAFNEIPKLLMNAVLSAEDKRFFDHAGLDPLRILKSAIVDVREGRYAQGASTLTMQLARGLIGEYDKNWKRKAAEVLVTFHLESRLTKQEIFTYYTNHIYMGRRGSFNVHGLGEAAQAYFGKSVQDLTVTECATLAAILNAPSYYNPYRNPDRVKKKRNIVLLLMRDNGVINEKQYRDAIAQDLRLTEEPMESSDAPYFVDYVNKALQDRFGEYDFQKDTYRVYTTLDLRLQRYAVQAVAEGMALVDEQVSKQRRWKGVTPPRAQVAMVVVDPETGAIRAMVGGRNYGETQLNRALAKRQPGSIFKPFVYSAAWASALEGGREALTPITVVDDEPTTFSFAEDQEYSPNNFGMKFSGAVTLREAMRRSLNIPAVKTAEIAGLRNVVRLARASGIESSMLATPALALGSYEVTPVEMAQAYTVFPNYGERRKSYSITLLRDQNGKVLFSEEPKKEFAMDARVAYMTLDVMRDVLIRGTGAGVRARGFVLPAAGKTGSSHDGWFAGFTSKLICIVWVGLDDNTDLKIEGGKSALPIWAAFMKRAHSLPEYSRVSDFPAPEGIVRADVCPEAFKMASPAYVPSEDRLKAGLPACHKLESEVFIAGTEPATAYPSGYRGAPAGSRVSGWDVVSNAEPAGAVHGGQVHFATRHPGGGNAGEAEAHRESPSSAENREDSEETAAKKKGLFRRLLGVIK
ncbi:MAG: PBP1A family penicillin-binding protein [Bryobacterales bacterium]|nr:PBP1A family penicillin-binding protein [Bryobacterales bacterium]